MTTQVLRQRSRGDSRGVRPSAFPFANHYARRWGALFVGWAGRLARLLRRLADEVVCVRLALDRGVGLGDLAASE